MRSWPPRDPLWGCSSKVWRNPWWGPHSTVTRPWQYHAQASAVTHSASTVPVCFPLMLQRCLFLKISAILSSPSPHAFGEQYSPVEYCYLCFYLPDMHLALCFYLLIKFTAWPYFCYHHIISGFEWILFLNHNAWEMIRNFTLLFEVYI